jgi:hypothetical protein
MYAYVDFLVDRVFRRHNEQLLSRRCEARWGVG